MLWLREALPLGGSIRSMEYGDCNSVMDPSRAEVRFASGLGLRET